MKAETRKPGEDAKLAARQAVRVAIAAGHLKRRPCEVCFASPTHAHHDDYAEPLEVRWLCPHHHLVEHPREGVKPWTTGEIAWMRKHGHQGLRAIAEELGRSTGSVRQAASRHGISLRRPGSRSGLVLGQPRGVSLRKELREDLVSGRVDPAVMAERLRIEQESELCPSCGVRPVVVKLTGLCRVCHLKRLREAHQDALKEIEEQRALWKSRQDLKRARDAAEEEGWYDRERGVI